MKMKQFTFARYLLAKVEFIPLKVVSSSNVILFDLFMQMIVLFVRNVE